MLDPQKVGVQNSLIFKSKNQENREVAPLIAARSAEGLLAPSFHCKTQKLSRAKRAKDTWGIYHGVSRKIWEDRGNLATFFIFEYESKVF